MDRQTEFTHKKFGKMEILVLDNPKRIMFSNQYLKKILNVKNDKLPYIGDVWDKDDVYVYLDEVFDYIKYAKVDEETRWEFEQWLEEILISMMKI